MWRASRPAHSASYGDDKVLYRFLLEVGRFPFSQTGFTAGRSHLIRCGISRGASAYLARPTWEQSSKRSEPLHLPNWCCLAPVLPARGECKQQKATPCGKKGKLEARYGRPFRWLIVSVKYVPVPDGQREELSKVNARTLSPSSLNSESAITQR